MQVLIYKFFSPMQTFNNNCIIMLIIRANNYSVIWCFWNYKSALHRLTHFIFTMIPWIGTILSNFQVRKLGHRKLKQFDKSHNMTNWNENYAGVVPETTLWITGSVKLPLWTLCTSKSFILRFSSSNGKWIWNKTWKCLITSKK